MSRKLDYPGPKGVFMAMLTSIPIHDLAPTLASALSKQTKRSRPFHKNLPWTSFGRKCRH
jgi:hypothetical protein